MKPNRLYSIAIVVLFASAALTLIAVVEVHMISVVLGLVAIATLATAILVDVGGVGFWRGLGETDLTVVVFVTAVAFGSVGVALAFALHSLMIVVYLAASVELYRRRRESAKTRFARPVRESDTAGAVNPRRISAVRAARARREATRPDGWPGYACRLIRAIFLRELVVGTVILLALLLLIGPWYWQRHASFAADGRRAAERDIDRGMPHVARYDAPPDSWTHPHPVEFIDGLPVRRGGHWLAWFPADDRDWARAYNAAVDRYLLGHDYPPPPHRRDDLTGEARWHAPWAGGRVRLDGKIQNDLGEGVDLYESRLTGHHHVTLRNTNGVRVRGTFVDDRVLALRYERDGYTVLMVWDFAARRCVLLDLQPLPAK